MAKIYEEVIIIKLSQLVKNDSEVSSGSLATPETLIALEQVTQELVGDAVIVEVEKA